MWWSRTRDQTHSSYSLRVRLAFGLGLFFLAGTFALYFAAENNAETAANRSYDRLLHGSALSIAETITVENGDIAVDLPYAALDMLSLAPDDRVFYAVLNQSGELVTGNLTTSRLLEMTETESPQYYDTSFKGEPVRFVALSRQLVWGNRTSWIHIHVGQTRRARTELTNELVLNSLAPIVAMSVCALIVVWFAIDWALRPLRHISREIAARRPDELSPISTPVPRDIEPLVQSLNKFMLRLSDNMEALRTFIAEAAHQMRTPLAALLAQVQTVDPDDPADLRRGLTAVERNAEKLTRLLNQLLSDSTVAYRSGIRQFEEFDLRRTLHRCILETVPVRNGTLCAFRAAVPEAFMIGDEIMISEAIKNLIHNSLQHGAGEDQGIEIELERLGVDHVIRILDRGPGIGNLDSSSLFRKFVRHANNTSGFGLGLAIVRRVVEDHDGTICLANREGGGLVVEIVLRGHRIG